MRTTTTGMRYHSSRHLDGEVDAITQEPLCDTRYPVRISTDPPHVFYDARALARHISTNGLVNPRTRAAFSPADVQPLLVPGISLPQYAETVQIARFLGFPVSAAEVRSDVGWPDVPPYYAGNEEVRAELARIEQRWPRLSATVPALDGTLLRCLPAVINLRLECAQVYRHVGGAELRWFRDAAVLRRFQLPPGGDDCPAPRYGEDPCLCDLADRFVFIRKLLFAHLPNLVLQRFRLLQDFVAFAAAVAPDPYLTHPPDQQAVAQLMDARLAAVQSKNAYMLGVSAPYDLLCHSLQTLRVPHTLERALQNLNLRRNPRPYRPYEEYIRAWNAVQDAGGPDAPFTPVIFEHHTEEEIDRDEERQFQAPTVLEAPFYRNLLVLSPL